MSRNILLLLDGLPAGGLERQVVELLRGMRERRKFKMLLGVLVKGGEREKEARDFAHLVIPIRQQSRYDLTLAFSLPGLIEKYQFDCIHSFGTVSDISAIVAGKIKGIPVINGSIRSAPPELYGRYRLSRWCMPFVTWIVGNSHAGLKAFGVDRWSNTSVIYNGIALDRFRTVESVPRRTSPELCMVANFTRKKDQEGLIRCFSLLQSRYPDARLTLVGSGERKRCEMNRLIESLKLNNGIELATPTDHPELYVKRSDICLLLTNTLVHGEGISNSIMEYMALAKPVIATDYGGNSELVEDGRTGFLVSDHRPETILRCVDTLLCNQDLARQMGECGRERLTRHFSLEGMVNEYEKLYDKILV